MIYKNQFLQRNAHLSGTESLNVGKLDKVNQINLPSKCSLKLYFISKLKQFLNDTCQALCWGWYPGAKQPLLEEVSERCNTWSLGMVGILGELDRSSLPQHLVESWTAEESKSFQSSSVSREKTKQKGQFSLGDRTPTMQMMFKGKTLF